MTRLAGYLIRLFSAEALAIFALASFLLFLGQCLRTFNVIAVKGQDIPTMLGQALLTMPTLAIAFAPVCLGIGLARGLKQLQQSQELHIIHSSRRMSALVGGLAGYIAIGAVLMVLLTNLLEPTTRRYYNAWAASIAADLVGRTLTPHRFIDVADSVTLVIGSREAGQLGNFFAHDRRNRDVGQTYVAQSASIAADTDGYVIQLRDGAIQYLTSDGQYSEITFTRYDLPVGRLTSVFDPETGDEGVTTLELINQDLKAGALSPSTIAAIGDRLSEAVRTSGLCLLVAALALFPHGRRSRFEMPLEIVVLMAAFAERGAGAFLPSVHPAAPSTATLILVVFSLALIVIRWRRGQWRRPRPVPA